MSFWNPNYGINKLDHGLPSCRYSIQYSVQRKSKWFQLYGIIQGKLIEMIIRRLSLIVDEEERQYTLAIGAGQSLHKRKAEATKRSSHAPYMVTPHSIISCFLTVLGGGSSVPQARSTSKRAMGQNIAELHWFVPRKPELYLRRIDELMGLPQGPSYFLKLLSQSPERTYMKALARVCNSIGLHKKRFDAITTSTEIRSGLWVSREVIHPCEN